jgi:hypothetical protein
MSEPTEAAAKEPPQPTKAAAKEPDVDPIRELDMFDNEEEYVGVDDKHIYILVAPAQPTPNVTAPQLDGNNSDYIPAKGGVPLRAKVNDADP